MASWMVHLRIADKLLDQLKDIDETAFVMGNIAPDSGVPNEDWTKFTPPKTVSHFNDGKYNASINIDEFCSQYFNKEIIKTYNKKQFSFFLQSVRKSFFVKRASFFLPKKVWLHPPAFPASK